MVSFFLSLTPLPFFFFLAYMHNFMSHFLISDAFSLACSRFPAPFLLIMKVSPACRLGGWLSEETGRAGGGGGAFSQDDR